ncbi:MAG: acyltransferase, partial [Candidatus Limnocylindrales bacterium]
ARRAPVRAGAPAATVHRTSGHLHAVDVVRFLTVGGVIAVHSTSLTTPTTSVAAGAVLVVLHVTRSVFLFLSAFVLGYSWLRKPMAPRAFWRRRYPLVIAPYVTWSAIYVLTGGDLRSPWHVIGTFVVDLFDGGAHFHLYFLLLTFQLYLVFPALVAVLQHRRRLHVPLLAASVVFEAGFCAAIHYGWRPPVLSVWLTHPGSWLPGYELYVVGGFLAAVHFDAVTAWVRAHDRLILGALVASVALALGSYVADMDVLGYSVLRASAVFQPVVVIESITVTLAQYALGLRVAARLRARTAARLERTSDVSFGVYLAHPLLVSGILDVAAATGLSALVGRLPGAVLEVIVVVALMPFVYTVTYGGVAIARRTRASLAVAGRRYRPPAPLPASPP